MGTTEIVILDKDKKPLSRLRVAGQEIEMYQEKGEAGFRGFGTEFQTTKSIEMHVQFLYQLKNALSPYIDHPVFSQC